MPLKLFNFVAFLSLYTALSQGLAQADTSNISQSISEIQDFASDFVINEYKVLGGSPTAKAGPIDPRTNLSKCSKMSGSFGAGLRNLSKPTVAVTCESPKKWTIYVPISASLSGKYVIASKSLAAGTALQEQDLSSSEGDISKLPPNIARSSTQILGLATSAYVPKGGPIRIDTLVAPLAFQAGQQIKIIGHGPGFSVSGTATAITTTRIGAQGDAKSGSGQKLSGLASSPGLLEIDL